MGKLESGIVGYLLGLLVGSLLLVLILGFAVLEWSDTDAPDLVHRIYGWGMQFHDAHQSWFIVGFILGVLSGFSSGITVVYQTAEN